MTEMPRRRFPIVPIALMGIALAATIAVSLAMPRRITFHGTTYDPVAPAADFRLVDQDGRAVTLASYRGAPLLVFFGYTRCADYCPQTLGRLTRAVRALGDDAAGARVALVTVDPAHDTPAALKAYVARFGPQVSALTGDSTSLSAAWQGYSVYVVPPGGSPAMRHGDHTRKPSAVPPQLVHSGVIYGIDRRGNLQVVISEGATQEEMRDDIRALARL